MGILFHKIVQCISANIHLLLYKVILLILHYLVHTSESGQKWKNGPKLLFSVVLCSDCKYV